MYPGSSHLNCVLVTHETPAKVGSPLVVLLTVEDSENSKEEVNDVKIEADGRSDFLLDVVVSQNQLCVYQNIAREDQSCDAGVRQLNFAIVREESSHEPKEYQSPESSK